MDAKLMYKSFKAEVKDFNDAELTVTHFISTEEVDRSGDIMRSDGMKLRGVPAVLKEHGFDLIQGREPIAKPLSITTGVDAKGHKGILVKTQYYDGAHLTPPDNTGRRLYEKAKGGFMDKWSIGYMAIQATPIAGGGRDVKEWELHEYSQVAVPDNMGATTAAGKANAQYQLEVKVAQDAAADPVPDRLIFEDETYLRTLHEGDTFTKGFTFAAGDVTDDENGLKDVSANEHACRLADPIADAVVKRVNGEREHKGKKFDVIYQKHEDGTMRELGFCYPRENWTAAEAEAHSKAFEGAEFEAAADGLEAPEDMVEVKTTDGGFVVPKSIAGLVVALCQAPRLTKSLGSAVAIEIPYRSLQTITDAFYWELWDCKDEKDVNALLKEFVALAKPYCVALVNEFNAEREKSAEAGEEYKSSHLIKVTTESDAPAGQAAPGSPAPDVGGSEDKAVDLSALFGSGQANGDEDKTIELPVTGAELQAMVSEAVSGTVKGAMRKLTGKID